MSTHATAGERSELLDFLRAIFGQAAELKGHRTVVVDMGRSA